MASRVSRLRPRRAVVGVLAALVLPLSSCGTDDPATEASASASGLELFDPSVVHSIEVTFDDDDYRAMLDTYAETGEKESIVATVTIDGVTYDDVGLRLKGNSSLAGLGGNGRGGTGGDVDEDRPETLPWLIELDEFVDQAHDGYEDIVIRSNNSATSLNEAVALDLLEEAGLASQEAMATSFSVNGSDAVLRLALEHPDDDAWYERAFDDAEGALYKAESTGDWSYRGDDPDAYDEVFDQEGGSDVADLTPLIEFLEFLNESDDETFAAELPDRLDVDAFATYLAMMDLVDNFDDIDGPGNNAYLWWDAETEQFTVVPWDLNLAFGGLGGAGGGVPGGGGGPGGFDAGELPEGFEPGELPEGFEPGELPEGFEPPDGVEVPEGGGPGDRTGGGFPGGGRGGFGAENPLVTRFLAVDEFAERYDEALAELREALFDSGRAEEILDEWVETLSTASELIDDQTVADEADSLRSRLG